MFYRTFQKLFSLKLLAFLCCTFLFLPNCVSGEIEPNFTELMLDWRRNSALAEQYREKALEETNKGNSYKACIDLRIASKYGVSAYESLIKATQNSEPEKNTQVLEDDLNKWMNMSDCLTKNI